MNKKLFTTLTALCAFVLSGCQTGSTTAAQVFTPDHIAQATQDAIGLGGTAFLANNPSYLPTVQAAADAFAAIVASNPAAFTTADVQSVLSKTKTDAKQQAQLAAIIGGALGIFERDFATNLPTLKPNYALFVKAVANGLNGALGKPPIP